jgi:hypothetical protein
MHEPQKGVDDKASVAGCPSGGDPAGYCGGVLADHQVRIWLTIGGQELGGYRVRI